MAKGLLVPGPPLNFTLPDLPPNVPPYWPPGQGGKGREEGVEDRAGSGAEAELMVPEPVAPPISWLPDHASFLAGPSLLDPSLLGDLSQPRVPASQEKEQEPSPELPE